MDTQDHAIYHVWIHFIPTSLYPMRRKNIWSELESNPGPLASQATALTTRPWLLGLSKIVALNITQAPRCRNSLRRHQDGLHRDCQLRRTPQVLEEAGGRHRVREALSSPPWQRPRARGQRFRNFTVSHYELITSLAFMCRGCDGLNAFILP